MRKWINKGDTPFLNGGGCLIAKADDPTEYDVFWVNTEAGDNGDKISAQLIRFDLALITEEDVADVLFACGYEDECEGLSRDEVIDKLGDLNMVKEAVESLGGKGFIDTQTVNGEEPMSYEDTYLTEDELVEWIKKLGADEFID